MMLLGVVMRNAWNSTSSPPPVIAMRRTALLAIGSVLALAPGCV